MSAKKLRKLEMHECYLVELFLFFVFNMDMVLFNVIYFWALFSCLFMTSKGIKE